VIVWGPRLLMDIPAIGRVRTVPIVVVENRLLKIASV
jgi:hypothetical protein